MLMSENLVFDKEILKKLSKATRIEVKEEEIEDYLYLLNRDVKGVENILEVNTDNVKTLTNPYDMILKLYPDIVSDGNKVDELMGVAPASADDFYLVPKILDKQE